MQVNVWMSQHSHSLLVSMCQARIATTWTHEPMHMKFFLQLGTFMDTTTGSLMRYGSTYSVWVQAMSVEITYPT